MPTLDCAAIGYTREGAMAALMTLGATADEAVEIANRYFNEGGGIYAKEQKKEGR